MRTLLEQYPTTGTMDRINAILRPTEFTDRRGMYVRLLECLEGLPTRGERVTAYAYAAFDAFPFAYFSGPETRSSEYPDDDDPRMQALSKDQEAQLETALQALIARSRAVPTTLLDFSDHVWTLIEQLPTIPERVLALAIAVRSLGVHEVRLDVSANPPPKQGGEAAYQRALWEHRQTVRECRWLLFRADEEGVLRSKSELGHHLLALLSEIENGWERGCVLAFLAQQIAEYGHDRGREKLSAQPTPLQMAPRGRRS